MIVKMMVLAVHQVNRHTHTHTHTQTDRQRERESNNRSKRPTIAVILKLDPNEQYGNHKV